MSGTFTATPDAVISGGAVAAVVPADGDLASAASILVSVEKSLNVNKKLVNQALLAGLTPSILDVNATNGLLYASELTSSVRARIYARGAGHDREIVLTINASWNGTVWTRDTNLQDAVLFGLMGPSGLLATSGYIHALQFDTTTAATWTDSGWNASILSTNGTAAGAGVGIIETSTPVAVQGGIGYKNSWADYTTGGVEGVHFYKDPNGRVWFQGGLHAGANGTVAFTLPNWCWPLHTRAFRANLGAATDNVVVSVSTTGDVTVTYTGSAPAGITLDGCSFN